VHADEYADDSTFYIRVSDPDSQSIVPAIEQTALWSANNHMLLNADKTVIMNFHLNYLQDHRNPVLFENSSVNPSQVMKF
jgi:hypothetical protein